MDEGQGRGWNQPSAKTRPRHSLLPIEKTHLLFYGGGFATIPAYLKDLFGAMQVGAIYGRLLTAWSIPGVLRPALVNFIREY